MNPWNSDPNSRQRTLSLSEYYARFTPRMNIYGLELKANAREKRTSFTRTMDEIALGGARREKKIAVTVASHARFLVLASRNYSPEYSRGGNNFTSRLRFCQVCHRRGIRRAHRAFICREIMIRYTNELAFFSWANRALCSGYKSQSEESLPT